jgi:hypothetical protein
MALNRGLNPNNLRSGQIILIPAGYSLSNLPFWFRSQELQEQQYVFPEERTGSRDTAKKP